LSLHSHLRPCNLKVIPVTSFVPSISSSPRPTLRTHTNQSTNHAPIYLPSQRPPIQTTTHSQSLQQAYLTNPYQPTTTSHNHASYPPPSPFLFNAHNSLNHTHKPSIIRFAFPYRQNATRLVPQRTRRPQKATRPEKSQK
jgi:hypothetical protein